MFSESGGLDELRREFESLKRSQPSLYAHLYNCEGSSGDMVFNSRNCLEAFNCEQCEDCRYLAFSGNSQGSYDCTFNGGGGVRFSCETVSTLGSDCRFLAMVWHGSEVDYSMECHNSRNLFGCVGLKRAENCIFNKQYTEAEYRSLKEKIIAHMKSSGEWGEFFPVSASPYAYNDSVAQLYLPLAREEALRRGYRWNDEEARQTAPRDAIVPPGAIADVPDSIVDAVLKCEATGRGFKLNRAELDFYRKMSLPVPRLCPEERHRRRAKRFHHFRLYPRQCARTGEELLSIYSAEERSQVLSEQAFLERAN
jgi:hypothetical protein